MTRYIDGDKLWNDRPQIPEGKSQDYMAGFSECMWAFSKRIREQIDNSTADVVPKSEVESMSHKCEDCAGCTQWVCECSLIEEHAKSEVAREIFEEIEDAMCSNYCADSDSDYPMPHYYEDLRQDIAELKKKYTEEQPWEN